MGDTLRAYGFGIFLSLLTCALLWRFVEKPTVGRFAAAAVAVVTSVHVLYYDAVLLLAFCAGASAVCASRRAWKDGALVVVIGALAAISLLPYVSTIRAIGSWNPVIKMPEYTFSWFWTKVVETVSLSGSWMPAAWTALLGLSVLCGLAALLVPKRFHLSQVQREVILFSLVALLVGVPGNFLFLRALSYYTEPWYYLALLALIAVCADAIFGAFPGRSVRIIRLALVLLLAVATLVPTARAVRMRLTNVDVVTAQLDKIARAGDVVLVAPWTYGVSFDRYYRGAAGWMTVPPMRAHHLQRFDLLNDLMRLPDQTLPARVATDQAAEALQTGHRVFVAGQLSVPRPGFQPAGFPLSPAPGSTSSDGLHERQWYLMVGQFLAQHAVKRHHIPVNGPGVVSHYEEFSLRMLEGWR